LFKFDSCARARVRSPQRVCARALSRSHISVKVEHNNNWTITKYLLHISHERARARTPPRTTAYFDTFYLFTRAIDDIQSRREERRAADRPPIWRRQSSSRNISRNNKSIANVTPDNISLRRWFHRTGKLLHSVNFIRVRTRYIHKYVGRFV